MARLVYSALASLDGFVADESGNFEWAAPDIEVHAAVNAIEREAGTTLLGRRMYDVLKAWETMDVSREPGPVQDFAGIWHSADKVVFSRTLERPATARTRIEREFDPSAVRRMKQELSRDMSIGGPHLAALAFQAGLIDDLHLFVMPVVVGGGNPALPRGVSLELELVGVRRFAGGAVHLHHRVRDRRP